MKRLRLSHLRILAAGIALFGLVGCATEVAVDSKTTDVGTYQWGTFRSTVGADLERTFRTTIRTLDKEGYFRTGERRDKKEINIYARAVGDDSIRVTLTETEPGVTQIAINYGEFGNLPASQRIFRKISENLK